MQHWFTSDEHIGHRNALLGWPNEDGTTQQAPRPWSTLDEMRDGLTLRHNELVRPGDLVYHLGDMFWRTLGVEAAVQYMQRLNGQHFYVLGNHDELMEDTGDNIPLRKQFIWIREREKIRPRKGFPSIVLDHYAGRVWRGSNKGSWQLYGHSHGNLEELPTLKSFDVGVDANNFYPVSLDQVAERMARKVCIPTPKA